MKESITKIDPNNEVHTPYQDFPTRFQLLDRIEAKNELIAILAVVLAVSMTLNLIMLAMAR